MEDLDTDVFWPSPKSKMSRARLFGWSLLAWVGVGLFWFVTTRGFHPSRTLAIVVTVSLVTAYAIASYLNHLVLIPQYWRTGHYFRYVTWLIASMVLLTAAAFAVLRTWYIASLGPGRDPGGLYINYAIDLFGMAVHLLLAAFLVQLVGLTQRKSGTEQNLAVRQDDLKPAFDASVNQTELGRAAGDDGTNGLIAVTVSAR